MGLRSLIRLNVKTRKKKARISVIKKLVIDDDETGTHQEKEEVKAKFEIINKQQKKSCRYDHNEYGRICGIQRAGSGNILCSSDRRNSKL